MTNLGMRCVSTTWKSFANAVDEIGNTKRPAKNEKQKAAMTRRPSTRAGISLTQMLVVIALTGVITMSAISVIISMLHLEGRATRVWLSQQTLQRLSDSFREDAHAARFAQITTQNDAPALIFQTDADSAKSVTYLATANLVTRRETDGDKLLRSEVYRLPDSDVRFGATGSASDSSRLTLGQVVRLTCRRANVQPINQRTPPPRHDEHVLTVLGRDHRFEKPTAE